MQCEVHVRVAVVFKSIVLILGPTTILHVHHGTLDCVFKRLYNMSTGADGSVSRATCVAVLVLNVKTLRIGKSYHNASVHVRR